MPQFGLLFLVNAFFIIHAARTGRFWPWAYVIFFLPVIGVLAYIVFEVLPAYRGTPRVRKAKARLVSTINPHGRYRQLAANLEDAETVGGRLALAQECLRLRKYDEALAYFEAIIATPQGDEPLYHLGKAQAEFGQGRPEAALATLGELKRLWPAYQSQDGHLLFARALEQTGRDEDALHEYEGLSRSFAGQEVQVRRLQVLDRLGRRDEARAIAEDVARYAKRCPSYARKQQAEWFGAAKSYLKKAI